MTDSLSPSFNLLSLFELEEVPDEQKDAFLTLATQAVLTAVVMHIEKKLPKEKCEEFHNLFAMNTSHEKKTVFLDTYVPDFKNIVVEEMERFKREAVAHAAEK